MTEITKMRYSDNDLAEFEEIVLKRMERAKEDLRLLQESYRNDSNNGTEDTAPQFRGFDEGSEAMQREQNRMLATRQESLIRDLKNALDRIKNKTYGVCRVTGQLILKERLRLVPHATLSIEVKRRQGER